MWLRIAARCGEATEVRALVDGAPAERTSWARRALEELLDAGCSGPVLVLVDDPPDAPLLQALRWAVEARHVAPKMVAPASLGFSQEHLRALDHVGVRSLHVTLCAATAARHDVVAADPGSFRRTLALLAATSLVRRRVRVGVHFALTRATVDELPGVLRLAGKVPGAGVLLCDGALDGVDADRLSPPRALVALDSALALARSLGVRVTPVGFERLRGALRVDAAPSGAVPVRDDACVATGELAELLREGVALPSAARGLRAVANGVAPLRDAVRTGAELARLAFELAAGGYPLVDLPPCIGGAPPGSVDAPPGRKVAACEGCPVDRACKGLPEALADLPGVADELRPPGHWRAMPAGSRVVVVCGPAYDSVFDTSAYALARGLAGLGARVDVVTPWGVHGDVSPRFAGPPPVGQPPGTTQVDAFIAAGRADEYDLVVTPNPRVAHPLVTTRRPRGGVRLAVTDFHMLGGVDEWARELGTPGRRPEEGGWWPSEDVVLYSAFPGYSRLFSRYGIPPRQVAWQPFALDPSVFAFERAAVDGTLILSAGNHRRDVDTLLAAAVRLGPRVHPIDLYGAPTSVPIPRQVRHCGRVAAELLVAELARSRFLVVPLLPDPYNAAGITSFVTAILCGRPVVSTTSAGARDYVIHGVNGLLVPPGDAAALADAIERLDTDPALLATLADGARAMAEAYAPARWAGALLQGSRTYAADHWMWTKWHARRGGSPRPRADGNP